MIQRSDFIYRQLMQTFVLGISLTTTSVVQAGIMADTMNVQTYRDFAENRGVFAPDARNVAVYDKDGNIVGSIDRVMNFDGVADAHGGEAALVGGQGFIATVAHDYGNETITFAKRFGATSGTAFYDEYKSISIVNAWGSQEANYTYDYRVQRLSKIVTEATAAAYLTDKKYLDNMTGRLCVRVGSGTQTVATGVNEEITVYGAYSYLTGGTLVFEGMAIQKGTGAQVVGDAFTYDAYRFWYNYKKPDAASPLNIGIRAGDSGSPTYFFNPDTQQWEWMGAGQSGGGSGYDGFSQMRSGNIWAEGVVTSYDKTFTPQLGLGDISMSVAGANGAATLTLGSSVLNYTALGSGLRGDTSTGGSRASNQQLNACHNLIFGGQGGRIVLQGSLNTGAGILTFNSNYTLTNGGDANRRLNSAGFVINAGATVTTELTGTSGDEWRKVGEGTLVIAGAGVNAADLNVGGKGLVVLSRTGGAAARNVKLNAGDVIVRLSDASQISGNIVFGHRGGIIDLNGTNRSDSSITHLDYGATFSNLKVNAQSVYTFTGNQTYMGRFQDGGSLSKGLLNVVYQPGTNPTSSVWKLTGEVTNKGTWAVNAGTVEVMGFLTLHAGGYVDQEDWTRAYFETGNVTIATGATFRINKHAVVSSSLAIASGATFEIKELSQHSGDVVFSGGEYSASVGEGVARQTGQISGATTLTKSGVGELYLGNTANSFSGVKAIDAGLVRAEGVGALGSGSADWTIKLSGVLGVKNAEFSQVRNRIVNSSSGTYALTASSLNAQDLTGYSSLYLGALGEVSLGSEDTIETLKGWTADGGWNLGGGGGNLIMNFKLSGAGTLNIGNASNTGTVTLTNIHNSDMQGGASFSGTIVVNEGVMLKYTDIRALGVSLNNILVEYGNSFDLGADISSALDHINGNSEGVLNFSSSYGSALNLTSIGLNKVYLGAETSATLSGMITPGTNGYRFGGYGVLTVSSDLSGTANLVFDSQNIAGKGTLILTGNNTYNGTTNILNGGILQVGNGGVIGSLGSGAILNNGALIYKRSDDQVWNQALSGTGTLEKWGKGTLTVVNHSYIGTTKISEGTLKIGNGGTAQILQADVTNNGILVWDHSNNLSWNKVITGSGSFVKRGSGTFTIQTKQTYTGETLVEGGILSVGIGGSGGLIRGVLSIGNGAQVNLVGGDSLGYNGDNNCVRTISISGGTLYFSDTGNQTFKNTVFNLTGATITGVNNGRFDIWDDATINVKSSAQSTIISNINVQLRAATSSIFTVEKGTNVNGDLIIHSKVVDSGGAKSFTKAGNGTMVLTGTNTYTGITYITGGTLKIGNGSTTGVLGTGNVENDSVLEVSRSNTYALNNLISGKGELKYSGSGSLLVTANNTYTGATTIVSGTVEVGSGGTSGALGGGAIISNGVLKVNRSNAYTLNQVMSGLGSLVKQGTGELTLSGASSYEGGTILEAGSIMVGSSRALGQGSVLMKAGTLDANSFALANAMEVQGAVTLKNAGALTGDLLMSSGTLTNEGVTKMGKLTLTSGSINGGSIEAGAIFATIGTVSSALKGYGVFTKTGGGKVTLSGTNTLTGATLVQGGELEVSGSLGSSPVTVSSGATLNLSGTATGNISMGSGSVLKTNASTGLILSSGQILSVGHSSGTAYDVIGGLRTSTGSTLTVNGDLSVQGGLTLGGGGVNLTIGKKILLTGALAINGATTINLAGILSGSQVELMSFASLSGNINSLTLTGAEFSGNSRVTYSLAQLTNKLMVNTSGAAIDLKWIGGAGTWQTAGIQKWTIPSGMLTDDRFFAGDRVEFGQSGAVTIQGNVTPGAVLVSGSAVVSLTGSGSIMGTATLTMQSTGTLTMNTVNTYTGGTMIQSGTVVMTGAGSLGGNTIQLKNGTLNMGGLTVGNALVVDAGILLNGSAYTGALTKQGSGELVLQSAQKAGQFTLNGGKISGSTLNASSYALSSGEVSSIMTGAATVIKSGNGEVTLSGINTYTGATQLNAGTLTVAAGGRLTSSIQAASNTRLNLYGSTNGNISMSEGAILYTMPTYDSSKDGLVLTNQTLVAGRSSGTGTDVYGHLQVGAGSTLDLMGGRTSVLNIEGDLTLNAGTILFSGTTLTLDRINVSGHLDITGNTFLDIDVTLQSGVYTLMKAGAITGNVSLLNVKDKGVRSSYALSRDATHNLILNVSHISYDITWDGVSPWVTGEGEWDFHNGDHMIFDKGGVVHMPIIVEPSKVSVNGDQDLVMSGNGGIKGAAKLVKTGDAMLTLSTANLFTGGVEHWSGKIKVTVDNGLGLGPVSLLNTDRSLSEIIFEKVGILTQKSNVTNLSEQGILNATPETKVILDGIIDNQKYLTISGNWEVKANVTGSQDSRTILSAGTVVKSAFTSEFAGELILVAGKNVQSPTIWNGPLWISEGGKVVLNQDTALKGQTVLDKGALLSVRGTTVDGGKVEVLQGATLNIDPNVVFKSDVSLNPYASLTLLSGVGVEGCLEVMKDATLLVKGTTAKTGLIVLNGTNQMTIDSGAILNADLYLGTKGIHTMTEGQHLGGNFLADIGSTLYVDGFVRVDGDYDVTQLTTAGGNHTLYFNMSDPMITSPASSPVFSLGGTMKADSGLRIVIDTRKSTLGVEEMTYSLFSQSSNQTTRQTINAAKVEVLDEGGWVGVINSYIFERLSGQLGFVIDEMYAPRGIAEVATNTLWSSAQTALGFSTTIRERALVSSLGKDFRNHVWVSATSHSFNLDDEGRLPGCSFTSMGYAVGADFAAGPCWNLGVALGQSFGKNKMNEGMGDTDQDSLMFGLYTDYNFCESGNKPGPFSLSAAFIYGTGSNDGTLQSPDLLNERFSGSWDDDSLVFDVRGTWTTPVGEHTAVNLFAGLQYVYTTQADYTLSGQNYNYSYRDGSVTMLRLPIGVGLSHYIPLDADRKMTFYAATSVIPDVGRSNPEVEVTTTTRRWTAEGANPGDVSLNIRGGVSWDWTKSWAMNFNYALETTSGSTDHSGRLSLMYSF